MEGFSKVHPVKLKGTIHSRFTVTGIAKDKTLARAEFEEAIKYGQNAGLLQSVSDDSASSIYLQRPLIHLSIHDSNRFDPCRRNGGNAADSKSAYL